MASSLHSTPLVYSPDLLFVWNHISHSSSLNPFLLDKIWKQPLRPSNDLKGELKWASVVDDESPSPLAEPTKTTEVDNGFKKPRLWRASGYIDTQVEKVFAAKNPGLKLHLERKMQSQGKFCNVSELSAVADTSGGLAAIDLGKALRRLAAVEPHDVNDSIADLAEGHKDLTIVVGNFLSEFHLPG
ncbi:hypothetical protein VNO78_24524 [Psophocarpus tetragonolobus]|uniref:Uncharacterized protein n=1 Tax=Psophocarpus tetragonolobus TaxID=3891 RepID=A0AAN9XF58_PSOTE